MKTFVCVLFFCIQIAAQHNEWFWKNPLPQGNNITSVFYLDSSLGWMCGDAGTILKTTDGGLTYKIYSFGHWNFFRSIYFADSSTGWVAGFSAIYLDDNGRNISEGEGGIIYKTTDGGNTWSLQYSNFYVQLNSCFFTDINSGYAVGSEVILSTTDGGVNWIQTKQVMNSTIFVYDFIKIKIIITV